MRLIINGNHKSINPFVELIPILIPILFDVLSGSHGKMLEG